MNCSHCGESMRNRQAMDEHMEKNHADKAANRCLTCGTYFHSIRSQAQHRCKSKPGGMQQQKQTPKRKTTVKTNQIQEENDLATAAMNLLNLGGDGGGQSARVENTFEMKFFCKFCDKSYMSDSGLQNHMKKEHQDGAGGVGIKVVTPVTRNVTPVTRNGPPVTRNGRMISSSTIVTPMTYQNFVTPQNSGILNGGMKGYTTTPQKPRIMCDFCNKTYANKVGLSNHIKKEHPTSVTLVTPVTSQNMEQHPCEHCDEVFNNVNRLLNHIHEEHQAKRTQTPSLSESIESIDSNKGSSICGYCNKSFAKSGDLKRHINTVHTKAIEYNCAVCAKRFYDPNNLRRHEQICQGERKIHCDFCSKSFTTVGDLNKHVKKIHDEKMPHQNGIIPGNQNVDKTPEMYPIITPPDTPENDTDPLAEAMRENSLYEAIDSMGSSNNFVRNEHNRKKFVKPPVIDPYTKIMDSNGPVFESMLEGTADRYHDNFEYPNDTFKEYEDDMKFFENFQTIPIEGHLIFDTSSQSLKIVFSGIGDLNLSKEEMQMLKDNFTDKLLKKQQDFHLENPHKNPAEAPSKIQMEIQVPKANAYYY